MKLWQRQPNETDKSFAAFQIYMNLPPFLRSIDEAYRIYTKSRGKVPNKHATGHFTKWASDYNWVSRASAHDEYLAEDTQRKIDERIIANRETRAKSWEALRGVALKALSGLDLDKTTLQQITAALKTANEGEINELGDNKPNTQITINNALGIDISKIDELWGTDE